MCPLWSGHVLGCSLGSGQGSKVAVFVGKTPDILRPTQFAMRGMAFTAPLQIPVAFAAGRVATTAKCSRRARVATACSIPSFSEEETGRPPNFFGVHDPSELDQIWNIHKQFVGERPAKGQADTEDATGADALDGLVGGGLHEAVLEALKADKEDDDK